MERCDFTDLDNRQCGVAAKNSYAFVDDDGGEQCFYNRCEFHPVAEDEHAEDGLMRYRQPLDLTEVALETHFEQIAQWNEEHNLPPFNERIS